MGDVISLAKAKDERQLIWVCKCGCTVHYARSDGQLFCGSCEKDCQDYEGSWRERFPKTPDHAEPLTGDNFKVVPLSSPESWLKRRLKDSADMIIGIVIDKDGSMSTFVKDLETDEQHAWLDRKMTEARERMGKT